MKKVLFLLFMFCCLHTHAQTLDQQALVPTSAFEENNGFGQSFLPNLYGTFASIQFQTYFNQVALNTTSSNPLAFSLYSGTATSTNGLTLRYQTTLNIVAGVTTVNIPNNIICVPGQTYVWYVSYYTTSPTANFLKPVALQSASIYANGNGWFFSNSSPSWDVWFKSLVNVQTPPPTTTATSQTFCQSGTVANLQVSGTAIKWYTATTGGSLLTNATALTNNTIYYASKTLNALESVNRLAVTALLNTTPTPAPTATSPQSVSPGTTLAGLTPVGVNIK